MTRLVILLAACGSIALAMASPSSAATFCVSTVGGLQSTLTIAQNNGADDRINIVGGSYALAATLTFNSSEAHALVLEGGWNTGCTSRTGAATILSGQNQVPILDIFSVTGNLTFQHLTFTSGRATASLAAPIEISSNSGEVLIELNQFVGNRSLAGTGALSAYAGTGGLRIRNNLMFGNRGSLIGAAILIQDGGDAWATGNTIVANVADQTDTIGGLAIGGSGFFTLTNNILWNNAGASNVDFRANSAHNRYNNDIGLLGGGTPATQIAAEQYVDPVFEPCPGVLCFNFRLDGSSPLVNAGFDGPAGGQSAVDLNGNPRTIGAHVDIGAYESDVLFSNGFE